MATARRARRTPAPAQSDAAVTAATGHDWAYWNRVLEGIGAAKLPHREIAARLGREHGLAPWWRQMIAVEYERAIGRRQPGQRADGQYDTSASRTLDLEPEHALAAWRRLAKRRMPFDGVAARGTARVTRTEKWRYWRVELADGSRVAISVGAKGAGRSVITADHRSLANRRAADRWQAYWRGVLAELG